MAEAAGAPGGRTTSGAPMPRALAGPPLIDLTAHAAVHGCLGLAPAVDGAQLLREASPQRPAVLADRLGQPVVRAGGDEGVAALAHVGHLLGHGNQLVAVATVA